MKTQVTILLKRPRMMTQQSTMQLKLTEMNVCLKILRLKTVVSMANQLLTKITTKLKMPLICLMHSGQSRSR